MVDFHKEHKYNIKKFDEQIDNIMKFCDKRIESINKNYNGESIEFKHLMYEYQISKEKLIRIDYDYNNLNNEEIKLKFLLTKFSERRDNGMKVISLSMITLVIAFVTLIQFDNVDNIVSLVTAIGPFIMSLHLIISSKINIRIINNELLMIEESKARLWQIDLHILRIKIFEIELPNCTRDENQLDQLDHDDDDVKRLKKLTKEYDNNSIDV